MPPDPRELLRNGQLSAVQVPRAPTRDELAEADRVRGLTIRTNAMQFAVAHFAGEVIEDGHLLEMAKRIAAFIEAG